MNNRLYKNRIYSTKEFLIFLIAGVFSISDSSASNWGVSNSKHSVSEKEKAQTKQNLCGSGLCFTPNKGQIADMNGKLCPDVLYKGDGGAADIYLRKTGISYVYSNMGALMHEAEEQVEELIKAGTITREEEQKKKEELLQKESFKVHRVDMDFANCNKNITTTNEDEVDGYQNFYYAHCPNGVTNVKQYNKVITKNIYNGIYVTYYGTKQSGIKYDIVVQPHADPGQIKLKWSGAESIHLKPEGDLAIKTSVSEFTESIPKVYQNINGKIVDVSARYVLKGTTVNFEIGTWNKKFPLIIDPWSTYYGQSADDLSQAIATDNIGNLVITGYTRSVNFPVLALPGGYSQAFGGGWANAFIVKFSPTGARLWATLYGGSTIDVGQSIATDNLENIVITGYAGSANFPTGQVAPNVVFQPALGVGASNNAFVVKFDPAGLRQWATFYGGNNFDMGTGIDTDNSGNVVITGFTSSSNFPILAAGGYSQAYGGGGNYDAFVVKFDPFGTPLWATFYGGSSNDKGSSVVTDNLDNIIITGQTASANFPVLPAGGYSQAYGANTDAFIVKFNLGGICQWASFYGGTAADIGQGIITDNFGNIIITGYTNSNNFPITFSAFQPTYGGGGFICGDAFLVKFDNIGARQWATYYGGATDEWGWSLAIDGNNNIYLLMEGEDNPTLDIVDSCSYQPLFNGGSATDPFNNNSSDPEDQIIVKFTPAGNKICSTYIGGIGEDDLDGNGGREMAIFGNSLYITGYTDGGYPVTTGAFQTTYGGGLWDAFVISLCTNICEGKALGLNFNANTNSICANAPVTFIPTVQYSCDTTGYKFHWTFAGGNPASSDSVTPTVTYAGTGTHDVKLVVTTLCKKDSITKNNYITVNTCTACNLVGQFTKGTASCASCGCKEWIMVNATGGTSPYSYSWADGYSNRYKNGLCPGNYNVTIKDKNGCSIDVGVTAP